MAQRAKKRDAGKLKRKYNSHFQKESKMNIDNYRQEHDLWHSKASRTS